MVLLRVDADSADGGSVMGARMARILLLAVVMACGATLMVAPQAKAFDVYTTPGEHSLNGRQWRTWCERYSQTARCRTEIISTVVLVSNGRYHRAHTWTFNNLTYVSSPEWMWVGNPLATPGEHTVGGRRWRTECRTPETGYGCRSWILADVVQAVASSSGGYTYVKKTIWVFNNIIQFGALRTDLDQLVVWRPSGTTAPPPPAQPPPAQPPPTGSYDERRGPNWTDRVTLTFDDCPETLSAFKDAVNAARDLGIALALLPTGNCIVQGRFDPAYARARGHYVFNHSISHPDLTTLTRAGVRYQLGSPGMVTTYGRPPFGAVNSTVRAAYADVGMRIWLWNIDTHDWKSKTQSQVVSHVVTNARAGNSVLMHMQWNGFNGAALRQMRDGLAGKGIGLCRNRAATTPVAPAVMDC